MRRALFLAPLLALLLTLGACGGGATTTTQQQATATQAPTKTPVPPTATPKPKAWVTVQTFSGDQNTKTPTFQLNDGDRIVWSAKAESNGVGGNFSITSYSSDGTYGDLIANTSPGSGQMKNGEYNVHGSGKVYLDISALFVTYTVTVQAYR